MKCLLNSFAYILKVEPQVLIEEIGHDGSEIWNPCPEPFNRRAFHPQELIDCCLRRLVSVTEIQLNPFSRNQLDGSVFAVPLKKERFHEHLNLGNGVLAGFYNEGIPHAVAWENGRTIDGYWSYSGLARFNARIFFLMKPFDCP